MIKFTKNSNWNALSAFGGSGYKKASADNNKKSKAGKNLDKARAGQFRESTSGSFGKAGLISERRIQEKKDREISRRNARGEL